MPPSPLAGCRRVRPERPRPAHLPLPLLSARTATISSSAVGSRVHHLLTPPLDPSGVGCAEGWERDGRGCRCRDLYGGAAGTHSFTSRLALHRLTSTARPEAATARRGGRLASGPRLVPLDLGSETGGGHRTKGRKTCTRWGGGREDQRKMTDEGEEEGDAVAGEKEESLRRMSVQRPSSAK